MRAKINAYKAWHAAPTIMQQVKDVFRPKFGFGHAKRPKLQQDIKNLLLFQGLKHPTQNIKLVTLNVDLREAARRCAHVSADNKRVRQRAAITLTKNT